MKKLLALLLAAMMLLSLAACGGGDDKPSGNEDNPPSSGQQQEDKTPEADNKGGGASNKTDGGEMIEDADNADYDEIERLSGIASIGNPSGYEVYESTTLTTDESHRIYFESASGDVAVEDIEKYAAALWNLCVDLADDGALYKYSTSSNEITAEYKDFSDAMKREDDYSWCYGHDGKIIQMSVFKGYGGGDEYLALSVTILEQ